MEAYARNEIETVANADTPKNAMLLRADIHALFDDYQWSLWVRTMSKKGNIFFIAFQELPNNKFKVVRFEKSGATALAEPEQNKTINFNQSNVDTDFPSSGLIRDHFRTALLLHVRGFGRSANATVRSRLLKLRP